MKLEIFAFLKVPAAPQTYKYGSKATSWPSHSWGVGLGLTRPGLKLCACRESRVAVSGGAENGTISGAGVVAGTGSIGGVAASAMG